MGKTYNKTTSGAEGAHLPFYVDASEGGGGLAQLARAPALHAGGHRFDSDILHLDLQ